MQLVVADEGALAGILKSTYPIWGEGLSPDGYEKWNRAQGATVWGRDHLRRVALVDGDEVLASAKRYDLRAWVAGRPALVLGIGAVFTPEDRRGRGHARALIELMTADAAVRGCTLALLFSEIGAEYYEQLGFHVVPQRVPEIEIAPRKGVPAALVRTGGPGDLDAIAQIASRARAAFALDRSADHIAFFLARRRLLAGLGPAGLRSVEFFVVEEAYRAVAYVVIARGPHGVVIEDCGDCDPSGARVGAMLHTLVLRNSAEPILRCRASLPLGFDSPCWRVLSHAAPDEIMMVKSLGESLTIIDGQTVYPHLDVF